MHKVKKTRLLLTLNWSKNLAMTHIIGILTLLSHCHHKVTKQTHLWHTTLVFLTYALSNQSIYLQIIGYNRLKSVRTSKHVAGMDFLNIIDSICHSKYMSHWSSLSMIHLFYTSVCGLDGMGVGHYSPPNEKHWQLASLTEGHYWSNLLQFLRAMSLWPSFLLTYPIFTQLA